MYSFLVISTGGTIASRQGEDGLAPSLPGTELVSYVPEISRFGKISITDLFSKDSSNMSLEDWRRMALCLLAEEERYDGFLILHGTDTMAYSS
ncbi:MAG: L-asparaginase 1, partial [Synergistaceae bacterium]|nr:L-asparaginase 1 [Synergistaceae bacterium]